jgi:hypothetical protein
MIVRYETEVRQLLNSIEKAHEVRRLRVDEELTWRGVGEAFQRRWMAGVGEGDEQSLGATLCHIAAELLGEDPDGEPWN